MGDLKPVSSVVYAGALTKCSFERSELVGLNG